MDAYEDIKSLGRGAFANVRLVRRKIDGEMFVVKKFHTPMTDLSRKEREEIAQEVKLLAHLSHENIVRFVDNFVEDGVMHILMEYATGGTLHTRIVQRHGEFFDEDQIWEWFVQIVVALKYVHSRNVLHRDLKTQNIMLSGPQQRTIKLGDFGIAKVLGSQAEMANTVVGTPHYLSPELCQGQVYDQKSDVWALGCILYELAALRKPFEGPNMPAIIFSIMRNRPPPLPPVYSDELKALVSKLLQPRPEKRPTVAQIEKYAVVQTHLKRWASTRKRLQGPLPTPLPTKRRAGAPTPAGTPPPSSFAQLHDEEDENENDRPKRDRTASGSSNNSGGSHRGSGRRDSGSSRGSRQRPSYSANKEAEEALIFNEIDEILRDSDPDKERVQQKLNDLQQRITDLGGVSGHVLEAMGSAWAEAGRFDAAIDNYREALACPSANASLHAMEQLGNILVRRAQEIWSAAEAGDETTAEKVAADAAGIKLPAKDSPRSPEGESRSRGRNANTMQSLVQKAAWKAYSQSQRSLKLPSKDEAKEDDEHLLSKSKSPREDSAWRELASSLMMEGLGLLERLCWLGQTSERRSLLGSAYKRRAWTGLGESRKADLQAAAQAYEEAHALELRANPTNPSPYARLNQLTLELAAGNGSKEERDRLIPAIREAEKWAAAKREANPADVWLWVQGMDAMCLRYLLHDGVSKDDVLNGYKEQFAFGASQRVKSSVLDQFRFLITVIRGRLNEEEDGAPRGRPTSWASMENEISPQTKSWLQRLYRMLIDLRKNLEVDTGATTRAVAASSNMTEAGTGFYFGGTQESGAQSKSVDNDDSEDYIFDTEAEPVHHSFNSESNTLSNAKHDDGDGTTAANPFARDASEPFAVTPQGYTLDETVKGAPVIVPAATNHNPFARNSSRPFIVQPASAGEGAGESSGGGGGGGGGGSSVGRATSTTAEERREPHTSEEKGGRGTGTPPDPANDHFTPIDLSNERSESNRLQASELGDASDLVVVKKKKSKACCLF